MDKNLVLLYCVLCLVNVVLQTLRSVCTIKCGTLIAAIMNAVAYGLYTVVIIYTNAEGLSLVEKIIITMSANFVGVYFANFIFNKIFKNEFKWKVEISIPSEKKELFEEELKNNNLEYYYDGEMGSWRAYSVFCPTRKDSIKLKKILPSNSRYNIIECIKTL